MEEKVLIVMEDGSPLPLGSGLYPAFDPEGRLRLSPEIQQAVAAALKVELAKFACDLLDAVRGSGDFTVQRIRHALQPYAAEAAHTCGCCERDFAGECRYWTTPEGTTPKVCLACHDLLQEVGQRIARQDEGYAFATEQAWVEVRKHVAGYCVICNDTGLDPYSQGQCYGCAQPNSRTPQQRDVTVGYPACSSSAPTPEQVQDLPEAPEWSKQGVANAWPTPIPKPPASACCGASVFEERGRTICAQCRVGCKLR